MNEPFTFEQIYEVGKMWRRYFPSIPLHDVYDKELSALLKEVKIDLAALDRHLSVCYHEESEALSMEEIITAHFGKPALKFIKRLI